jgi:phage nucleotide-binding protein
MSNFQEQTPQGTVWNNPDANIGQSTPNVPNQSSVDANSVGNSQTPLTAPATNVSQPVVNGQPNVLNNGQPTVDAVLDGILGQIGDVGQKDCFKVLIYGDPGTTKSSKVAEVPNNLVVDLEGGLISAKGAPLGVASNVKPYTWKNTMEFEALLGYLYNNHPAFEQYTTFSIDSFSDLHKRCLTEVTEREWMRQPSRNRYVPTTDDHQENNERMMRYVRVLRDLNRNIIITAHSKTVEPKNKPAKTYPDFSENLANKIEGMMDIVAYMSIKIIDQQPVPVMQFFSDGQTHAKTRVPLPFELPNPTMAQLFAAWEASKNQ